jgi:hypothetical protein
MRAKTAILIVAVVGSCTSLYGSEYCPTPTTGDPVICLAWEQINPPELDVDFEIETTGTGSPTFPNVKLLTGDHTWRIWSKGSSNSVRSIGFVSCPSANDFSVQIRRPDNSASGANHVKGIALVPTSTSNYANILGGSINGDVENGIIVQAATSGANAGAGGEVHIAVGGVLKGASSIPRVALLASTGSFDGTLVIERLVGDLRFHKILSQSTVAIDTAAGATNIYVTDEYAGSIDIGIVENDPEAADDLVLFLYSGIAATGRLDLHDLGSATTVIVGAIIMFPVNGTIKFWEGITEESNLVLWGSLNSTGIIDLNNGGIKEGASLRLNGGGSGSIVNGGNVDGTLKLGEWGCDPPPASCTHFTGSAVFTGAGSSALVTINDSDQNEDGVGESHVEFTGTFGGDICGTINDAAWPTSPLRVPANIHLAAIGTGGTVCGSTVCGSSSFSADSTGINKSRFVSFTPSSSEINQRAIGVRLGSLHDVDPPYSGAPTVPFEAFEGKLVYVGPPGSHVESIAGQSPFKAATTQCEPHYQDWSSVGLLHVTGSAIVPSSEYAIEMMVGDNASCASTLGVVTTRWGDIETPFAPPSTSTQPDLADVSALVNKFRGVTGAPIKARALLAPNDVYGQILSTTLSVDVGFTHIAMCVDAFRGARYPGQMGKCATAEQACTIDEDCTGGTGPCELYCP